MERGMRWKLHVPCGVGEKLAITSKIYLSQLFKEAVKYPTARIIIGHNHPSGDPEPSQADWIFTKRMIECGNLMGIELFYPCFQRVYEGIYFDWIDIVFASLLWEDS